MKLRAKIASWREPYWWVKDKDDHKEIYLFTVAIIHHAKGEQIAFKVIVLMFIFALVWDKPKPQKGNTKS